jgi:hypothetical protein
VPFLLAAFNTLPWNIPVARALAFIVKPLSTHLSPAPTYPPAWAGRPEWEYWGGLGVITAVEYENTPVGPYSELIYTVGFYKPNCKAWAPSSAASILRIWVDSSATCDTGRRIWRIPKEKAFIQWHETDDTLGVTVTDAGSGEVLLNATAKDAFARVDWFRAVLPTSLQTVHWPIDANKQRPVAAGTVPAYKGAEAALAEGKALTTTMHVDYTGAVVNKATSVFINQEAFTGRQKQQYPLGVVGAGVSFKSGDANPVWSIPEPSVC